jgi:hypothetical protein
MFLGIRILGVAAAFVTFATGANTVGQCGLAAFAVDKVGYGYMVVGTAHVSFGFGCFLLG